MTPDMRERYHSAIHAALFGMRRYVRGAAIRDTKNPPPPRRQANPMSEQKESLIERLERASGPDREIDVALAVAFIPNTSIPVRGTENGAAPGTYWEQPPFRAASLRTAERYTASLDAALALCERVLPGWGYRIRKDRKHGNIEAFVDSPDDPMRTFIGRHDKGNDALALCLAILRARASLSPGEKTDG